ncbi:MAG: hypothetical protein QGH60_16735 [Phycisphaerae bacterium]|nr:hypothetical protein [Phycisphaerae bacterium]
MKYAAPKTHGALKLVAVLLVGAVVSAPLTACTVPVFRYALEKWHPGSYHAIVFHRGALSKEKSAVLDTLTAAAKHANLEVRSVDLDKDLRPWPPEYYTVGDLPRMVLLSPSPGQRKRKDLTVRDVIWSSPLDKALTPALTDSPKRREISRLIRSGESAVWVLLDSGDAKKDAAAAALTKAAIAKLAAKEGKIAKRLAKLKLLKPPAKGPKGQKFPQLRLSFSMLRVSRADPAEKVLVEMLLSSEKGLRDAIGPILFPIVGRGRVIGALVDRGINETNITEGAEFLTGRCTCQVKNLSPGLDMLISTDWNKATKPAATTRPSDKTKGRNNAKTNTK